MGRLSECCSSLRLFCQISFIAFVVFYVGTLLIILGFAAPIWTSVSCRSKTETAQLDIGYIGMFTECYPTLLDSKLAELNKYATCSILSAISCTGSVNSPSWQTAAKIILCLALIGCIMVGAFIYKSRCNMPKKGKTKKKGSMLGFIMVVPGFLGIIGDIIYGAGESWTEEQYNDLTIRRRLAWAYVVSVVGCILLIVAGVALIVIDNVTDIRNAKNAPSKKRRPPSRRAVSPSNNPSFASPVKISSLQSPNKLHSATSTSKPMPSNGSGNEVRSEDAPAASAPFVISGRSFSTSDSQGDVTAELSGSAPFTAAGEGRPLSATGSNSDGKPVSGSPPKVKSPDKESEGNVNSPGKGSIAEVKSSGKGSIADVRSLGKGSSGDVKSSGKGSSADLKSTGKGSNADLKSSGKGSNADVKSPVRARTSSAVTPSSLGRHSSASGSTSNTGETGSGSDVTVGGPFVISGRPFTAKEAGGDERKDISVTTGAPASVVAAWGDGSSGAEIGPGDHAESPVSSQAPRSAMRNKAGAQKVKPLYVDEYEPVVNM